jgi:hypothetical protein
LRSERISPISTAGLVAIGAICTSTCARRIYPGAMRDPALEVAPTVLVGGGTITDANSPAWPAPIEGTLTADTVFGGRYRIARFLASGGMGEVYEARDELLRESVAVKLLRTDLLRKPGG